MRRAIPILGLLVLLAAAPAQAIVSFGVYGGMDVNSQDAETLEELILSNDDRVSLEREEINSPLMGGLYILVDATPFIDVEVGVEASVTKYNVVYDHTLSGDVFPTDMFDEEAYFGRIGVMVSGKLNMLSLPTMKGYVGAGLGYHLIAPLVSGNLLEDQIAVEGLGGDDISPEEVVSRAGAFGGHLLVGARFKVPVLPFSLRAEGRYYFVGQNDFEDDTNNFLSIALGLGIGF